MTRKIAIIGTARSSVYDGLKLDASWEIWSLNGAWELYKDRASLHFELHSEEQMREDGHAEPYLSYLTSLGDRLVVIHENVKWISARKLPVNEIVKHFNSHKYFNNTAAYMLAFAIMQNPSEIAIFGVDMATDDFRGGGEYTYQRPCCEYYMGWAEALGIKVTLPDVCPLRKTSHMYALEKPTQVAAYMKGKYKEVMEHSQRLEADKQNLMHLTNVRTNDIMYFKGQADLISTMSKQLHYDTPIINRALDKAEQPQ